MARKKKLALTMSDGVEVRDLDELRRHFDGESAMKYFRDGRLLDWLIARYYEEEAEAVAAIDKDDPEASKKLCVALGVDHEKYFDEEFLTRVDEKRKILKTKTKDETIIGNARLTALTQEDLADLLDLDEPKIYLCGEKFTVPWGALSKPKAKKAPSPKTKKPSRN